MADEEVATKAPESDAQESPAAGDTKAQEGPSMGVGSESGSGGFSLLIRRIRNTV